LKNILWWFGPRIFENSTLVRDVHQIRIGRVRFFSGRTYRNIVFLRIGHQVEPALVTPFAPGSDYVNVWLQRVVSEFKANLIVTFASGAVSNRVSTFLLCNLNLPLRNHGARERRSHQVHTFINSIGFDCCPHVIANKLFAEILDVEFRRASRVSLFLESAKFGALTNIGAIADDFAVVVMLQPMKHDGSIQATGVSENYLVNLFHLVFVLRLALVNDTTYMTYRTYSKLNYISLQKAPTLS
jgi:hypothetical protein